MIEVSILGSGVTAPNHHRAEPGHHLKLDGASILWDGGSGNKQRMIQAGIDPFALTHVFYTHLHTDHVSDLAPLLFMFRNSPNGRRTRNLKLTGPPGFEDYYQTMRRLNGEGRWWDTPDYEVELDRMLDDSRSYEAFSVRSLPMNHMERRAIGYRIEDASGAVVTFSGDTDECEEIVTLGRRADLLILECSWPDDMPHEGHLTPARCGRIAAAAEPKELVLVHMYPPCEDRDLAGDVAKVWDGPVTVARDGQRFSVGV